MVPQPNPLHQHWVQLDQAILSAFISSMTEGVVGMVMFAATTQEAWETLVGAFAATSLARSSGIHRQMAELKKRDMTMTVYFHKMKALFDELTSICQPLRDVELISYLLVGLDLLVGLGYEYNVLYVVVNARTTPMLIRDLYAQLLATEHRHASLRTEAGLHYHAAHLSSAQGVTQGAAAHVAAYSAPRWGCFRSNYRPDARTTVAATQASTP
uniref:Uncharacterized protein n=1 Tax=Avena sativa TaxID=4498 RepID=A0ACD5ZY49_AVESA